MEMLSFFPHSVTSGVYENVALSWNVHIAELLVLGTNLEEIAQLFGITSQQSDLFFPTISLL